MMSDVVTPDYIEDAARVQEDHTARLPHGSG
jgi:hypothetical protein